MVIWGKSKYGHVFQSTNFPTAAKKIDSFARYGSAFLPNFMQNLKMGIIITVIMPHFQNVAGSRKIRQFPDKRLFDNYKQVKLYPVCAISNGISHDFPQKQFLRRALTLKNEVLWSTHDESYFFLLSRKSRELIDQKKATHNCLKFAGPNREKPWVSSKYQFWQAVKNPTLVYYPVIAQRGENGSGNGHSRTMMTQI